MTGNGKTIHEVLSWFGGVTPVSANEWKAVCPNCSENSKDKHLYIAQGTKNSNAVLLTCFHHCEVKYIMSAIGKTPADLFLDASTGKGVTVSAVASNKAENRVHTYTDESGSMLYRKQIKKDADGHKTVWWEAYDPQSNLWQKARGTSDTPLYGLSALATSQDKTVFITEGEKDADLLHRVFNLTATTAGGAKNWKDRHTDQLRKYASGKTIVILTDNDAEGAKMGETVLKAVKGIASEAYIINPLDYWTNAPEKADISDYYEAMVQGMSAEDAKIEAGCILTQLRGIVMDKREADKPRPLDTKTADSYESVPHRFLWDPYLPIGQYTVLLADSGTGKSVLTCGIAAAITTGTPLPTVEDDPFMVCAPADVLFISSEDSGAEYKARLAASGADLSRVHIVDCDDSIGLNLIEDAPRIVATAKAHKVKLIVVDPWQAFIPESVDLNRMNMTRPVLQKIAHLSREADCALILISHVNKRAQGENANNAASGSSELVNAARSAIKLVFAEDSDGDSERLCVHTKSSYAAAGKTVKFKIIEHGGLAWTGFSEVTRSDLEKAARNRKTVKEMTMQKAEAAAKAEEQREGCYELAEAVRESANATEDRRKATSISIAYKELDDAHGNGIFMGQTYKVALSSITEELKNRGFGISFTTSGGNQCKAKYINPSTGEVTIAKGFCLTRLWPYRAECCDPENDLIPVATNECQR